MFHHTPQSIDLQKLWALFRCRFEGSRFTRADFAARIGANVGWPGEHQNGPLLIRHLRALKSHFFHALNVDLQAHII